jgi:hypothetical protein
LILNFLTCSYIRGSVRATFLISGFQISLQFHTNEFKGTDQEDILQKRKKSIYSIANREGMVKVIISRKLN